VSRFAVEVLPEAEEELRETFLWYFERSPIAADAFRSLVISANDALADNADIWPMSEDGLRYHVLSRFPYTVWYELHGAAVTILAVAHQHRRPRYWKGTARGP
jgi:plasmid stabilization system protein ParE